MKRSLVVGIALTLAISLVGAEALGQGTSRNAGFSKTRQGDRVWWKDAVIYEIYPRSFQDSNGDGIGDLPGIMQRLDYLKELGVDAIWIAPMFPSPQVDFGYDISDYENVDPQYGTLADMDRLIEQANKRGIRVILDMVVNHTSDKHPWFIESSSSRTNPKRDWYIWNDGKAASDPGVTPWQKRFEHDGRVPINNWEAGDRGGAFGGSAWEWSPATHQFYYHKFYKQQPDLNWRNPAVERAMFDTMRFWLNRGVAGFRLDAVPTIFEDPQLRDDPESGGLNSQGDPALDDIHTENLPEVHGLIRRLRKLVDHYPGDRLLIGETYLPNTAELDKWYGGARKDELHLPMDLLVGFQGDRSTLDAATMRRYLTEIETQVHGSQPLLVFDNHDNVRSHDRYGDGVHDAQIDKVIATLLLASRGAALLYYGEELGMPTTPPTRIEDVKDPIGISGWPKDKGRDGERTPMQWDPGNSAGFSTNKKTWLPVPPNHKTINVENELRDPDSLLNWHKRLIALRHDLPALREGRMTMLDVSNPSVLSFVRTAPTGGHAVVVILSMSAMPQSIDLLLTDAGIHLSRVKVLLTSAPELKSAEEVKHLTLPPYAAFIAEVRSRL